MRVTVEELMNKLSVGYVLSAYDSAPFSYYDSGQGIMCNAEVRMGADLDEAEAEIQIMYDTPPEGKLPMEQVFYIKMSPTSDGKWTVKDLLLNGGPLEDEVYNWEEKSCNFFGAVVQDLKAETMPDIEELIDEHFHSRERMHDQYGGGGGKSPKIKAGDMGMKKGGGF